MHFVSTKPYATFNLANCDCIYVSEVYDNGTKQFDYQVVAAFGNRTHCLTPLTTKENARKDYQTIIKSNKVQDLHRYLSQVTNGKNPAEGA